MIFCFQFSSVQSLSHVQLSVTTWTAAHQAPLSITNSQSPPKLMSIESVMPSNRLILCHPLLLLSSIFPSNRILSNESVLCIRWPKYWSFSFSVSPSNFVLVLTIFLFSGKKHRKPLLRVTPGLIIDAFSLFLKPPKTTTD